MESDKLIESEKWLLLARMLPLVANLFYNMARKTVGLVGLWDCVAFDEVAGINFKDKDVIALLLWKNLY
ncbi:hypothetical protein B5E58_08715 [Tyzzerella sp. An114]|nr:BREX system Lon protease-like protein BrxL [Tyzzerella sp. An114]OUQ57648.1 hypothetical protein B5E58_08715 [Tyzzerella sp. An114]